MNPAPAPEREPGDDTEEIARERQEAEEDRRRATDPEWASTWVQRHYPPPEWLVPQVIPRYTVGAIVAPSHTGKTASAIKLLHDALAAGHTVGYVMEESTANDFRSRLLAAGVTEELQVRLLIWFQLGLRLDDIRWVERLRAQLLEHRVDLCFFDTWSDVVELNQLDQAEVLPVLKALRETRIQTGCTLVPLMHTPKAIFKGDTPPSLGDIFGSVAAPNILDFVHILRPLKLLTRPGEEDDEATAQPEGLVEIHCVKLRSAGAPKPPPKVAKLLTVPLGPNEGTTVCFEWVEGKTPAQVKSRLRSEVLEGKVLAYCAENDCGGPTAVYKGMGGNKQRVLEAVKALIEGGQLGRDALLNLRPGLGRGRAVPVPAVNGDNGGRGGSGPYT